MRLSCPYCTHSFIARGANGDLVRCTGCAKVFEISDKHIADVEEKGMICPYCQEVAITKAPYGELIRCKQCLKVYEIDTKDEAKCIPPPKPVAPRKPVVPAAPAPVETAAPVEASAPPRQAPPVPVRPPVLIHNQGPYNFFLKRLAFFVDDMSLSGEIIKKAYNEIVKEGQVEFPVNGEKIKQAILTGLEDTRKLKKEIYELAEGLPLKWPLYEACAQLCQANKLYPEAFYEIGTPPNKATSFAELLPALKVPEMKALLKAHGHKAEKKRDDIEQQILALIPWEDCAELAQTKWEADVQTHAAGLIKNQYEYLALMILHRAYYLRQVIKWLDGDVKMFKPKLETYNIEPEDKKLAKLLDGSGYSGIFKGNQVMKLLPLFPGDRMGVRFEYRR